MDKGQSLAGAEMTSVKALYNEWSTTYDEVVNPTRDLEKRTCEAVLGDFEFGTVLELGSGTGKNTGWLAKHAKCVVSIDLSEEMQAIAHSKVTTSNVEFRIGDVTEGWAFAEPADLVTCSLILEHVEDLGHIFREASKVLTPGGRLYVCELHPFKQYTGSKARFESEEGIKVLDCFTHHITDYTNAAVTNGFAIERIDEWFDDNNREQIPRLISFLFVKNS